MKHSGVIVGRFQVAALHSGHRFLIETALTECERVLVVLGVAKSLPENRNPLDYAMREHMIRDAYPNVEVVALTDHPSDACWSRELDGLIAQWADGHGVQLYGSRNSFLSQYCGNYDIREVPVHGACTGTTERQEIATRAAVSPDFRAGVIYREETRLPRVYPTVDVAVVNGRGDVLLGGKAYDQDRLCFIGGFVDATDASYAHAANRELHEEAPGIEIGGLAGLACVGSTKIDDWRYRGTKDEVITTLFVATFMYGPLRPSDDIVTLRWVPIDQLHDVLVPHHLPLADMLKAHLSKAR